MINYREIFNNDYSYIGLIIIGILIISMLLLDRKYSTKILGYSFIVPGIIMILVCILGNTFINSIKYSFFIEVISNNFFNAIMIFSVLSIIVGSIVLLIYKYIYQKKIC